MDAADSSPPENAELHGEAKEGSSSPACAPAVQANEGSGTGSAPAVQVNPEDRALFLGLDGAGKTTILRRLFNESALAGYQPTHGVNTKSHVSGDPPVAFMSLEVGGEPKTRAHWTHFLDRAHGLVYVVDASDSTRLEESGAELDKLLQDAKLPQVPVLVYANKVDKAPQDSEPVQTLLAYIRSKLEALLPGDRQWQVQPCSGKTGDGLKEGLDWLQRQIRDCHGG
mmetsp:Transcript_12505/g.29355  ORF Transcript_12505/g.29355 Transcript_12505/m.29355 type:complete len:226 (+) Transcript_12505:134-811(+)